MCFVGYASISQLTQSNPCNFGKLGLGFLFLPNIILKRKKRYEHVLKTCLSFPCSAAASILCLQLSACEQYRLNFPWCIITYDSCGSSVTQVNDWCCQRMSWLKYYWKKTNPKTISNFSVIVHPSLGKSPRANDREHPAGLGEGLMLVAVWGDRVQAAFCETKKMEEQRLTCLQSVCLLAL